MVLVLSEVDTMPMAVLFQLSEEPVVVRCVVSGACQKLVQYTEIGTHALEVS